MNFNRRILTAAVVSAFALALTGCPKAPEADPIEPGPRITSFKSTETLIDRGGAVTLSWETQNAASVKLENPRTGQAVEGAADPSGSVQVTVNEDTMFVLTAVNLRGAAERQALTVRVKSAAHDLMLYALPTAIVAGESAIITWSALDAQSVTLTANPGGAVNLSGQLASGSVTVSPTATTQYTLNADGKAATTTITVRPRIKSLSVSPSSAPRGGTLTVSWETVGAVEVALSGAGRGVLLTETDAAKVANGSYDETVPATVDPGTVYSYTLTAKDPAGATSTQELLVYVTGVPVVKTFTGPKYAQKGQTFTLAWTTEQADSVSLSAGGAAFYQSPDSATARSGTLSLSTPANKTTYTLTATNALGGSDSKTFEVEPLGAPTVSTFTAAPGTVNAGEAVTLSWTAVDAPKVIIREATDGVVYVNDAAGATGSVVLYPNHTSNYTLTADNTFGQTTNKTASVTVNSPVILTPSVTGTIPAGTTVQLTWNLPSATSIIGLPHTQVVTRNPSTGFDDISATGTKVSFGTATTDATAKLGTGFPVAVLGANVGEEIHVTTHGYMVFGPWQNRMNYSPVDLPTGKLEPYSIAPYWADLTIDSAVADAGVYWQIKTVNNTRVLIVQWNKMVISSTPGLTFQAKVYETGQVDFEYKTVPTGTFTAKAGVQGPTALLGVPATTGASGSGLTFFGPLSSPASLVVPAPMKVSGSLPVGSSFLRVSANFPSVVTARDLVVSEVMARPHSSIATTGEWVELTNTTSQQVDLTGWELLISDGGTFGLSGTIAPFSSLVAGQSTDPTLNGDAGVTLALAGLDLNDTSETATLRKTNPLTPTTWTSMPAAGTARVFDVGPIKVGSGTPSALTCAATQSFSSSPPQLGTPGTQTTCGFGYALQSIPESFFDISATGTFIDLDANDDLTTPITLPATGPAPKWFGVSRPVVSFAANGWLSFISETTTALTGKTAPSTTAPVGAAAIFWDDLDSITTVPAGSSGLHWKRVSANEDPRNPAPHWIFQWSNVTHYSASDRMNFQMKFFDDGTVEYHYADMGSGSSSAYASGISATVWIENMAGTQALPVVINAAAVSPHTAYRFSPR